MQVTDGVFDVKLGVVSPLPATLFNMDTLSLEIGGGINTSGVLRMDGAPVLKIDISGNLNTFLGGSAGQTNMVGHGNTFLGQNTGFSNTTGDYNVFIGHRAGYFETGSNKLFIDNSGTPTPLLYGDFDSDSLTINGTFVVTGLTGTSSYNDMKYDTSTGSFYDSTSPERYKEEIEDVEDDFYTILNVRPKTYVDEISSQREIGYIAEEFDEMGLNDLVIYNVEGLPYALKYDRIPLYLVEAIKDNRQHVDIRNTHVIDGKVWYKHHRF